MSKAHDVIEQTFTFHPPHGDQPARYQAIREAAKALGRVIVANTPACADQSAALRKLRECVMTANASIALEGITHPATPTETAVAQ